MCPKQAVSFATERIGWLHRKTEEKKKFFSTPTDSTSLCWSFCFAFLCPPPLFFFFSMLLLNISCGGKSEKTDSACQVSHRVLTFITHVK